MKFNTLGSACYGYSVVNVDGAAPAALSGRVVGQPSWRSDTQLIYQDGDAGAGPWVLNQLVAPATVTTLSATGANLTGGGNAVWAKWLGGEGVTTSWGGPFASAYLLTVSRDGQVVVNDDYQSAVGITVYSSVGAVAFALPAVVLQNNQAVRLQDNILSYFDAAGWHLVDITTGETPEWYPRVDGVNFMQPVTFDGTLYVLERTETLSLRAANRATGWELRSFPDTFNPDAVALSSTVRCGSCLNIGELVDSLMVFDVTVGASSQITVAVGTVSGGGIVYAAPVAVDPQVFAVGALEGHDLTSSTNPPYRHPVTDAKLGDLMTRPWMAWADAVDAAIDKVSGVVQDTPAVGPSSPGFDQVNVPGQVSLVSSNGTQALTLASADGSVTITTNPSTHTVDFAAASGSYVPVSTGAEPLVILSNGSGAVLLTPYTP